MPPNPMRAEFYRQEAMRLQRLADVATLREVRVNLARTARLYEAMARDAAAAGGVAALSPDHDEKPPLTAARRTTGSRSRGNS